EFGYCHRNEASGALHGLMRVRAFVQDDGHIFCTPDQIEPEVTAFNRLALAVYKDFGFEDIAIRLSLRPQKRIGSDEVWDRAEDGLRAALKACVATWTELPGDGAFYGPKIDYDLRDSLGRSWQCGTMQVDFSMPERLGAEYVAEDNTRKVPVMLHRAIVGSLERFIGILIENCAGALPLWLSPVQVAVLTITDRQAAYAREVAEALRGAGYRALADLRNEKITYKIREHSLQKLPYQLILGDKELQARQVAVRTRAGEDLGAMPLEAFVTRLQMEAAARR
ncbi:MAG: threonine--tRNA ligase, partial [Betaproteobacteria bacterium]